MNNLARLNVLNRRLDQMYIFLNGEDADQIREALMAALEHHGGDLDEDDDEIGVSEATLAFEARMREAIRVLDRARGRP